MILPPFKGSKAKIARADKHIAELSALIDQFAKEVVLNFEREDAGANWLWIPRFSMPPPCDVPIIMGDAVHNLRTALDLMICDLARLRGANTRTRLDYPFEGDEAALERKLTGKKSRYPQLGSEVLDLIRMSKPYKEKGHPVLYGLHELDMWDKHELVLPTYVVARAKVPMIGDVMKMFGINFQGFYPVHEGSKLSIRKDLGEPTDVMDFTGGKPMPQLPPGLPFAEKPILGVLQHLSKFTSNVVAVFETKFGKRDTVAEPTPMGDDKPIDGC